MIQIENHKFKALGGAYNITYLCPYYFKDLKFKALGTSYNISVKEIDKYHDLIDFGGFKRKWIHKNNIGNVKVNFNGKQYQSYNLNGKKPDLYFYNHKYKPVHRGVKMKTNEKFIKQVVRNYIKMRGAKFSHEELGNLLIYLRNRPIEWWGEYYGVVGDSGSCGDLYNSPDEFLSAWDFEIKDMYKWEDFIKMIYHGDDNIDY